jgi:hypothetical protein
MLESDRGVVVPIRGLKRNERTDDLTRSSERNKGICLTRSLTKNKTFCNGFDTTGLLISGLLVPYLFLLLFVTTLEYSIVLYLLL